MAQRKHEKYNGCISNNNVMIISNNMWRKYNDNNNVKPIISILMKTNIILLNNDINDNVCVCVANNNINIY